MPTSIATIQINAPAAAVYRYLATPHLISEWVGGLVPKKFVGGDGEIRLGLRSPRPGSDDDAGDIGADDHEPEIIKFEPDHSVSMRIESTGFIMLTRFHLFESDGVTTVRQSVQLSYKRWYRLFARITNRSVQRRITADLERLKKTVEDRAESDGSTKRIA